VWIAQRLIINTNGERRSPGIVKYGTVGIINRNACLVKYFV